MTHYLLKHNKRPYILCDHVNPYCAECLEYIDTNTNQSTECLQGHHLFRQAVIEQDFGQHYTIDWVVPVHQRCHQSGISGIDLLSGTLADRFKAYKKMTTHNQAKIARELHNAGNYGKSIIVKAHIIKTAAEQNDYDSCWINAEYCLASGSALIWSDHFLSHIEGMVPRRDVLISRPQYLLNKAKICAIQDDVTKASRHIGQVVALCEKLRGRKKKALDLICRRAHTSIRCNTPGASSDELACALADAHYAENEAESAYTASTAHVLRGHLLYKVADYRRSRDLFEEVLQQDTTISWGYRAMAWFHRALCKFQYGESLAEIYKDLVKAQYVQTMLGLTGHAHRATDGLLHDLPHDCMPGHILTRWRELDSVRVFDDKYIKYLTELRKNAIGECGMPRSVWSRVRASLEWRAAW